MFVAESFRLISVEGAVRRSKEKSTEKFVGSDEMKKGLETVVVIIIVTKFVSACMCVPSALVRGGWIESTHEFRNGQSHSFILFSFISFLQLFFSVYGCD
jgi:hypothetical protein